MPDLNIASGGRSALLASVAVSLVALANAPAANAADVNVTVTTATAEGQPNQFPGGLRWTLEEDVTHDVNPAAPPADPLDAPTLQFHKSYMPLAKTGSSVSPSFTITGLDASKRYYLSVLPDRPAGSACTTTGDKCYTMTGAPVRFATPASTTTSTLVTLTAQPLPPAQARVFAFDDTAPINNAWDVGEAGLGGFTVFIYDMGGPLSTDVFGNPLGTEYEPGTLDGDASPTITRLGDGTIHTMTAAEVNDPVRNPHALKVGEALIRNIAPGKYGIQIVPPEGQGWHQTTTIEGTKGIDVWIRAGEPMFAVEFGPTFAHAFYGFVKEFNDLGASATPGKIQGQVVNLRQSRPPNVAETLGRPLPLCYVGLNEMASGTGLYVARCNEDSTFEISGVPPGTYQLVVWDEYLDVIISFFTVNVGPGETVLAGDNGKVGAPRWFGQQEHYVFNDLNENGVWDQPAEKGIPDQTINFRFRDGSIYQSSTTDTVGFLPFDEIFPFFSWLIAEVDFARFKATGATIAVDEGGPINDGPVGRGKLNPQIQNPPECSPSGCESRTELSAPAPVLLEGFNLFAGNMNIFEWGKKAYDANENGGITGVVYSQTTRAENDPRFAAAETWEPGIPRVQLNLYRSDATGVILDNDGTPGIQLADVDNYPFGFQDGGSPGPEDIDRNANNAFDLGDALEAGHTDSWDDNLPTGCIGDTLVTDGRCYDGLRNFSQVRPAVFDGGYAFGVPFTDLPLAPGAYVVEAVPPPGYKVQDEASKNVDFGDTFVPHALPPVCVGDPVHTGGNQAANHYDSGAELSLFPGVEIDPAYLGDRPVCNFKQIVVTDGKNAAADFFLYTDVPVTGHIQGLVTNDIGNDTNPNSPNFGEKLAPSNVPVSIRDYAGNELNRVYTDAWGHYEGLVPSTYRISVPMPSGVSPGVVQICINPPTKPDPAHLGKQIPDPHFDPRYSQTCYSLNFTPGQTTYLDTPIIPVAAFVGTPDWQLDCNYPDGTPIIRSASVDANGKGGGPYIAPGGSRVLTLTAVGALEVPDPANPRPATVVRDFGFGAATGKVFLNGAEITTGVTWGASAITVNVPAGAPFDVTGQLEIQRANGLRTVHGITLIQGVAAANVTSVAEGQSIQAAIDATPAGGAVLVGPGLYYESLFMTKPIQLQGWGAAGTVINAGRSANYANLLNWREEAQRRTNCPSTPVADRIGLLPGQSNNTGGQDPCLYEPGSGLFPTEEAAGVLVAPRPNVFGSASARIDGFTITSADFSGGIIVNGYATNLEISNNVLTNNQGQAASGIRVGHSSLVTDPNADGGGNGPVVDAQNRNVRIHHNNVTQNGSFEFADGGGIGLYTGSDNYRVSSNHVCGNFTQGDGAGINHFGRSPGGLIENNQVLFNQSFDQTAQLTGGSAGGILIAGYPQPVGAAIPQSAGSGSVQIVNNRIQGNQAGSGDGGGIVLRSVNGQDVLASANDASWNRIDILNNLIVNNVAALAGGGIVLQDALRVSIINNTIVNNDSTATAAAAFEGDPNASVPQPAGVVSRAHSLDLQGLPALLVGTFSNPTLENNVILGNRMQHWEAASGLVVDGVHDLAVLGTAGALNAQFNVLTDVAANAGYNANNPRVPVTDEDALLAAPYYNGQSGIANGTFGTPLLAASATDEGGNFLSVVFGPISKTGDYHLQTNPLDPVATAKAIDKGTNASLSAKPALLRDMDGESRPVDGTAGNGITLVADIGADEAPAVALATVSSPRILSTPPNTALILTDYVGAGFTGVLFSYQVVAADPNGTAITFTVNRVNLLGGVLATPPGLAMSSTGLLTFTPASTGTYRLRVRATSGGQNADQFISLVVTAPSAPPVANPDTFNVNTNGTFAVPAPGVIGNDSASPLYGAMTAELVTNLSAGGAVTMAPDGSFDYLPDAGFVGTPTFQYRVSATRLVGGSVATSGNATVTLNRELAATSMKYGPAAGEWHFDGRGNVNGRTLTFTLDRTGATIGTTSVAANAWSFSTTTGPLFENGDTVTITATGGGPAAFALGLVPVIPASAASPAVSTEFVQCPGDTDGDAIIDTPDPAHPNAVCRHLAAGDGFIKMADTAGTELYTFGFNDVTGQPRGHAIEKGLLNAHFPAPTLAFDEGDEVYLTLTNVGTLLRPDLFDPHSVHFHGFPNAGSVFDGVPESSVTINQGFSFTYYYNIVEVGTFMYHCHVEAPEHMQMGMLGNLYVRPAQNGTTIGGYSQFVYNDGDGTTGYDVEVPIQIGSMDSNFHTQHIGVQPLPFANMHDDFPMLNGRGYPDTVDPNPLPAAQQKVDVGVLSSNESSQVVHTRIEANAGQRVLLRISNLNVTRFYTLATTGLPMRVVGTGAHILRGPGGASLYYDTSSVTLGGGEAVDVLVDTTGVAPGTYLLYSTNLEALSNGSEDFGGMMTEIVIH